MAVRTVPPLASLLLLAVASQHCTVESFVVGVGPTTWKKSHHSNHRRFGLAAAKDKDDAKEERQTLGLLTFDLDDTLYPIAPVEAEANAAVVRAMETFGFPGLQRDDLVQTAKQIRDEISLENPEKAAILTYQEIRQLAIRREMEKATARKKLQALAEDEATTVEKLSELVMKNAEKWAKAAVSDSQVKAVSTAWEMERHHASERHLYPEVVDALRQIKAEHPTAIIGAVTDGRSNPLFMTFTLAPYFDFACSWEDDQGSRQTFFKDLENTGGESSQLTWIYEEARNKYAVLKQAAEGMDPTAAAQEIPSLVYPDTYDDRVWIHVGDDLAFDVGGSKACGAKTIYCALAEKYGQTARHRFDEESGGEPAWSTTPSRELKMRYEMSQAAKDQVDVTLRFLTRLPEAVNDIMEQGNNP